MLIIRYIEVIIVNQGDQDGHSVRRADSLRKQEQRQVKLTGSPTHWVHASGGTWLVVRLNCLQVFFLRFKATSYNNQEDPQHSSTLPRSLSTTKTISQHFNNMFKTNSYHRSLTKTTTALPKLPATPILPKPTFDKPKPAAGRRCNSIMTHDSCLKLSLSGRPANSQCIWKASFLPLPNQDLLVVVLQLNQGLKVLLLQTKSSHLWVETSIRWPKWPRVHTIETG